MLQFNTLISLPLGASCSKNISPFDSSNNNHWSPISSRTLLYLADTCFVLVVTIDMHWHIVFMQIAGSFSYSKISFNKLNCSKLWCQPSSASCLTCSNILRSLQSGRMLEIKRWQFESTSKSVRSRCKFKSKIPVRSANSTLSLILLSDIPGCINLQSRIIIDTNFWANIHNAKFLPKGHTLTIIAMVGYTVWCLAFSEKKYL